MTAAATMSGPPARPPSRFLSLTEPGRAMGELAAFIALRPAMRMLPKGDGHGVLVLPGFMAGDRSTRPMRNVMRDLGYDAQGWNLGRNLYITPERVEAMADRISELSDQTDGKISIVGWSLGGVLARELTKLMPDHVRQVISLGSPVSDDRGHTNVRRIFEYFNGNEPDPTHNGNFNDLATAPPVPTTSILTKGDGVVHWRGSVQHPDACAHDECENIEVMASHLGLGVNPAVMFALADRLAQDEGEWTPFAPSGMTSLMYPRSQLH